ncbi:hypothetical protein YPPY58_2183, partial [Yersinia pestis PY-58]
MLLGMADG